MTKFNAAFWKWFGDSKVVDSNGQPLVVYHGTTAPEDFTVFNMGEPLLEGEEGYERYASGGDPTAFLGSHFAKEKSVANRFARGLYGESKYSGGEHGRVYPVYLSIQKLYRTTEKDMLNTMYRGNYSSESVDNQLQEDDEAVERYNSDPDFRVEVNQEAMDVDSEQDPTSFETAQEMAFQFREVLQKAGYDGIVYSNEVEGGTAYVVFEPWQIKSAIGNDGTYDPDDPDIRSNPGPAFIRFEHKNGLGLMNNSGLDRMKLTDDEEFELIDLMDLGLRQPIDVPQGAIFAFTLEGVKLHARLIKLLRKASISGVRKLTLDPESYRIVWASDDGQVALMPL